MANPVFCSDSGQTRLKEILVPGEVSRLPALSGKCHFRPVWIFLENPSHFSLSQGIGGSNIIVWIPWHHPVQTPCPQESSRTILFLVLFLIIVISSPFASELFELPLSVQKYLCFFTFFSQFSL